LAPILNSAFPTLRVTVTPEQEQWRADRALSALSAGVPRREAKLLFKAKLVRSNGKIASGADVVAPGDVLEFPDPASDIQPEGSPFSASAKSVPRLTTPHGRHLQRLYEDDTLLVISKPAEIPVHRGHGGFTRRDTIEDVLMEAYPPPEDAHEGAQGCWFVHRLDMETSGCLLVAKTEDASELLIEDFSARKVHKEYIALVVGEVPWKKLTVDAPIKYIRAEDTEAPTPSTRPWERTASRERRKGPPMRGLKKGVVAEPDDPLGKECLTHFQVMARFRGYTLVRAEPKSGRTHQIRVHLVSAGHPLAYDPLYGRRSPLRLREFDPESASSEAGEKVILNRLPLHAWKLGFVHPQSKEYLRVKSDLPRDLKDFVRVLKKFRRKEEEEE